MKLSDRMQKRITAFDKWVEPISSYEYSSEIDEVIQLEAELKIEKQKHLDTSNWALEQQDRADKAEAALKGKS